MPQLWGRQLHNYSQPDSPRDIIKYHRIDDECPYWVFAPIQKINDSKDIDIDPDYFMIAKNYNLACQRRYVNTFLKYNHRFVQEIQLLSEHTPQAVDSAHFIRNMSYTTLWPPLHTKREIDQSRKIIYNMKGRQRQRLNKLMCSEIY